MTDLHEEDCNGRCHGNEEFETWISYIGHNVRIRLTETRWVSGKLLDICVYGEAAYQREDGEVWYGWPVLECRLT